MSPEALHIIDIARRVRLPLHNEKAAQAAFSEYLTACGIEHRREVHLGESEVVKSTIINVGSSSRIKRSSDRQQDIVDFMVGNIAIEMKLKGSRMDFYRQVERYTQHDQVHELILLSARAVFLPVEINGKPVQACSLSAAFL